MRARAANPVAHKYPTPPPFLPRFVMYCLNPESWAQAARYRTDVTLFPLLLAILFTAVIVSWTSLQRTYTDAMAFASRYDASGYPALELSADGILKAKGPLNEPIRAELSSNVILIDPTGNTVPESIKTPSTFINDKDVYLILPEGPSKQFTIKRLADSFAHIPAGSTQEITGATMQSFLKQRQALFVAAGIGVTVLLAILETLWGALMIILVVPLVVVVAGAFAPEGEQRRLILPRRAAVRMAMAFLIPVFVADGILRAFGHGLSHAVGNEWAQAIWFVICAALAVYTGITAYRLYGPKPQTRQTRS